MTNPSNYPSILSSGKGARITDKKITDFSVEEVYSLIEKYRFLVFTDNPVTAEEVEAYLSQFGSLTQNNRRKGVVLAIDGSKNDEGEVLLGQGYLPLHRDGALMGTDVRMVGIFCQEYKNVKNGRTFVADTESLQKDIPEEYTKLLKSKGIEGQPVDSYYLKSAAEWHPIRGYIDVEGQDFLNIGFPSPEGEKPSWLIQIPGENKAKSKQVFDTLTEIAMDEKYCYYHDWQEGELILFDNRRTLHGREAFTGGPRALANIQVLAS